MRTEGFATGGYHAADIGGGFGAAGGAVTNVRAVADGKGRNVLCGMDGDMEFSGVVKPSDAAGFFSIGAKEAPGVQPSDREELEPPARMSSSE